MKTNNRIYLSPQTSVCVIVAGRLMDPFGVSSGGSGAPIGGFGNEGEGGEPI